VLTEEYLADGHVGYSYATTVHKAQGATYDRAFVLATESLTREAGYVSMSRARTGTELFVVTGGIEIGLGPGTGDEEPLARVAARLKISRAKDLASDQLGIEEGSDGDRYARMRTERRIAQSLEQRMSRISRTIDVREGGKNQSPPVDLEVDGHVNHSRSETPIYITKALGPRPMFSDERKIYDRVADLIDEYRGENGVNGDDALGPRPVDAEARRTYEAISGQIRNLDLSCEPRFELQSMEMGPQ
jgi:hypothetical protein